MGRTYDVLASGAAAYSHRDGVSTQGHHNIERTLISNVEALELDLPMLYLRRGLAPNSGGAGRHRGGLSVLGVYKPHKLPSTFMRIGAQWKVPDAVGSYGGSPGARTGSELVRNSDVLKQFAAGTIPEFDDLAGEMAAPTSIPQSALLDLDCVVRAHPPPAGRGDLLDRDPAAIQEDLEAGAISRGAAEKLYGCAFDAAGGIDAAATTAVREKLRTQRKTWPRAATSKAPAGATTRIGPMGDALEIVRDAAGAHWTRCVCGSPLGPAAESWREFAGRNIPGPADLLTGVKIHESMELREYACSGCGRASTRWTSAARVNPTRTGGNATSTNDDVATQHRPIVRSCRNASPVKTARTPSTPRASSGIDPNDPACANGSASQRRAWTANVRRSLPLTLSCRQNFREAICSSRRRATQGRHYIHAGMAIQWQDGAADELIFGGDTEDGLHSGGSNDRAKALRASRDAERNRLIASIRLRCLRAHAIDRCASAGLNAADTLMGGMAFPIASRRARPVPAASRRSFPAVMLIEVSHSGKSSRSLSSGFHR